MYNYVGHGKHYIECSNPYDNQINAAMKNEITQIS